MLAPYPDDFAMQMLELLHPGVAQDVLARFPSERRQHILAAAPQETRRQWMRNEAYGENTIGHMMEPPLAVYRPETTIAEATTHLRDLSKRAFITYVLSSMQTNGWWCGRDARDAAERRSAAATRSNHDRETVRLGPEMPLTTP